MRDAMDRLADLRPEERERLDRFAQAFERIDASSYITLVEIVPPVMLEPAEAEANRLLGSGARREAVSAVIDRFADEAAIAYSSRPTLTDTFLMFRSLPDRAEDRARFLAGLERAVVAVVLWDELTEDSRVALLGPWGQTVASLFEDEAG